MDALSYKQISEPFRANQRALKVMLGLNTGLKYLCYGLYPLLLVLVAYYQPDLLIKEIVVPAVLFIAVSLFRRIYNEPRPYEALCIDPLIHKDTKGKSMPSRHIFSIFMIAMGWLAYMPWVGILMLLAGCVLGFLRVVGGVHYPKDVVAGAAVAIIGGFVGFWILPLS